ncbi:lipopolysaccharide transport periplasmic protein LptA [Ferriphaselus sp. R-1]|uniref:lipopolysaccharide transport periplasmic protein LptA n=1 Tax=Ferriphaselus sp. R-1 TaxID=1485544 RepID=UPI000550C72F|nr:lipopolysaccharide transport periplasmic protein LptA [Ferriphaselus sp. R-1]
MFQRTKPALLCLLLLAAPSAWAERADRDQPMYLDADTVNIDDARQISIFEGNVKLTQGTLIITGSKIVVTETATGDKHGTITGKLAHFRQKRDGADEYVEGDGLRIEYDTRNEFLELFGEAHMKRTNDEVYGDHITYDSRTEVFHVDSPRTPTSGPRGRVRAVIQPKSESAPAAAEPVTIRSSTSLGKP